MSTDFIKMHLSTTHACSIDFMKMHLSTDACSIGTQSLRKQRQHDVECTHG